MFPTLVLISFSDFGLAWIKSNALKSRHDYARHFESEQTVLRSAVGHADWRPCGDSSQRSVKCSPMVKKRLRAST